MELRQLAYVVGVVDHGGFGRAAAALYVTQPTLSQGIRTLELELGIQLFHRVGRGAVLSPAGEAFVGPARQALRDAAAARAATQAVAGLAAGHLDIVALPTLAVDPLVAWIGAFRRAHPGITVRVAEPEDADAVAAMVRDGRCELGLAELPVAAEGLTIEVELDQEIVAVCPAGTVVHRGVLAVERLATLPLVATPPGTSTRRLVMAALAGAGVAPVIGVEVGQREAVLPLVLAGAGVSFVPRSAGDDARHRGAVVARLRPPIHRRVGLVRREGTVAPAAAAFLAIARG